MVKILDFPSLHCEIDARFKSEKYEGKILQFKRKCEFVMVGFFMVPREIAEMWGLA